jgi:hypothetical protein
MRPLLTDQKSLAPLNRGLVVTTTLTALVVAAVVFIGWKRPCRRIRFPATETAPHRVSLLRAK